MSTSRLHAIKKLIDAHPGMFQVLRDLVYSLLVLALLSLGLYLYAGVWVPIVSVDGTSMLDHLHQGDLVLVQGLERTAVHTYMASVDTGYRTYDDYGDVIVYYPYGDTSRNLIIHRAMYWVNASEPMWPNGPAAPWSGYITLGDNNGGNLDQATDICLAEPVKPEWIHGVAKYRVPFIGYLRMIVSP